MEVKIPLPLSETIIYTGVPSDLVEVEVNSIIFFRRANMLNDRHDISIGRIETFRESLTLFKEVATLVNGLFRIFAA